MSSKKITLFIDCHSLDKEYQGTHGFIKGLYSTLTEKYPQPEIYAGAYNCEKLQRELPFIKSTHILPYKKHMFGYFRFLSDIPGLIKKYNFDFAHSQYISPGAKLPCRYIVTLHDILFNDFKKDFPFIYRLPRNFLFKKSFINAAIKTTVSHYSRERIAHHYLIPLEDIHVIPSGPVTGFGQNHSKTEAGEKIFEKYGIKNFILCVSRIEPRKNQLLLLQKFLHLELYKKGIHLVFIGKNSIKSVAFQQLLYSLSKEKAAAVHWFEQIPPGDIELFYLASRLFAYPSKAEGFGLPPLEASICKIPVLCSNVTAVKDYTFFEPWCFDPANETDFEKKLNQIIINPPDNTALDYIASCALVNYSWEKAAENFYQLLQTAYKS